MELENRNRPQKDKREEEKKKSENGKSKKVGGVKALPLVKASNIVSNFHGTASLTTMVGALVADSFAGRYWTIVISSIIYELGLISLTTSAAIKSLNPPECQNMVNCKEASVFQLGILYLCLPLIAIGLGGVRPCVLSFTADQISMDKKGQHELECGLAKPTVATGLAFILFVGASRLYKKVKPGGSPLTRLAQVLVSAIRKRKVVLPEDTGLLYQNKEQDAAIPVNGRLLHTDQFRYKAAIVRTNDKMNPPNLWKLTVHRIEELKSFIRILPIWLSGVVFVAATSHQASFLIQECRTMNRHLTNSFQIPPASFAVFSILTLLVGVALYDHVFVPIARRYTGNPTGITCLQRIGVGLVVSILGTIVGALIEMKRKSVAAHYNLLDSPKAIISMSIFCLVPRYCLFGLTEVFRTVGTIEFLYDQSPESMRSIAIALYWVANALGGYLGVLVVTLK
ncbi:hypothetical protein K2173_015041 [Erythroxylum novogranatense]|uniref:Uncharacterized protein n=1 Tax=Erythroxylum novogranatense TaxID=1862640 RepID=A0AAV8TTZ1_9ROSI|nr:hypothetical protein K2173_015041 [Erythroxylum novogranatense]